ncbi:MAG: hypothetical protein E7404_03505 [Ruminococcaceae bacterium]|nr:hypothetical protein [Oscillospiraceae bacterium]
MDKFQKDFLNILKSALISEKTTIKEDFNWEDALNIAKEHDVLVMLYYGIKASDIDASEDIMQKIKQNVYVLVQKSTFQEYEAINLYKEFDNNKIVYMPLKGEIIKNLYPCIEMRYMGDIDVLIKSEQYDLIKDIMQKNGYNELCESDHEYIWDKPGKLHIELHKHLIPSYNKDYFSYYKDSWKNAKKLSETNYCLSDEDFFTYIFTHLAKHYRDGGIGIKHFVDLYVFLNKVKDLDKKYVEKELEKLNLTTFYKNVLNTVDVWFNDKEENEISDFITNKVFSSGAYGTKYNKLMAEALKKSKSLNSTKNIRMIYVFQNIFPSYKKMEKRNPILKRIPFLLPALWIVRWFEILFFNNNLIKEKGQEIYNTSEENVKKYQDELNFVGLDYNFKE